MQTNRLTPKWHLTSDLRVSIRTHLSHFRLGPIQTLTFNWEMLGSWSAFLFYQVIWIKRVVSSERVVNIHQQNVANLFAGDLG